MASVACCRATARNNAVTWPQPISNTCNDAAEIIYFNIRFSCADDFPAGRRTLPVAVGLQPGGATAGLADWSSFDCAARIASSVLSSTVLVAGKTGNTQRFDDEKNLFLLITDLRASSSGILILIKR